jgi:hypothetical protein
MFFEIIEIDSSNPSIALMTSLDFISALSDIPPGSINLVGDNNIIIINDYRPCCNIGKNILKDTLNDGKLRESATKSHLYFFSFRFNKQIIQHGKNVR